MRCRLLMAQVPHIAEHGNTRALGEQRQRGQRGRSRRRAGVDRVVQDERAMAAGQRAQVAGQRLEMLQGCGNFLIRHAKPASDGNRGEQQRNWCRPSNDERITIEKRSLLAPARRSFNQSRLSEIRNASPFEVAVTSSARKSACGPTPTATQCACVLLDSASVCGSSALSTARPSAGNTSRRRPFSSAIAASEPKVARCASLMAVNTPTCGRVSSARSRISSKLSAASSSTARRWCGSARPRRWTARSGR